jgi:glycosyltransferase involved in cell wall biosynthesis
MPRLSVVIAAQDAGPNLRPCVSALRPQLQPEEMEILVVDGSERHEIRSLEREVAGIRWLRLPTQNVPRLWRAGIAAARGEIVALTIENCVPAPDWAEQVLRAHTSEWLGIGGAIEMDPHAGLVDWAVYFCRYSGYMLPFAARFQDDVAGDNCSYKRETLAPVEPLMCDGFWETFIHADMRRRQEELRCDPAPVVTYRGGLSAPRFCKRRYIHGRYFATRRGVGFRRSQKLVRAAAFPAVALLLLRRIAAHVWRNGRHRRKFIAALPLIGCFLLAWAAGEAAGYLTGKPGANVPGRD